MFAGLQGFQRQRHMREIRRGNHDGVQIGLNEVGFLFMQGHIWRDLQCTLDAFRIIGAQGDGLGLPTTFLMEELQMTVAHGAYPDKTHANLACHVRTLPDGMP